MTGPSDYWDWLLKHIEIFPLPIDEFRDPLTHRPGWPNSRPPTTYNPDWVSKQPDLSKDVDYIRRLHSRMLDESIAAFVKRESDRDLAVKLVEFWAQHMSGVVGRASQVLEDHVSDWRGARLGFIGKLLKKRWPVTTWPMNNASPEFWRKIRADFEAVEEGEYALTWFSVPPRAPTGELLESHYNWCRSPNDGARVRLNAIAKRAAIALGYQSEDGWYEELRRADFVKFKLTGSGNQTGENGVMVPVNSGPVNDILTHSVTLTHLLEADSETKHRMGNHSKSTDTESGPPHSVEPVLGIPADPIQALKVKNKRKQISPEEALTELRSLTKDERLPVPMRADILAELDRLSGTPSYDVSDPTAEALRRALTQRSEGTRRDAVHMIIERILAPQAIKDREAAQRHAERLAKLSVRPREKTQHPLQSSEKKLLGTPERKTKRPMSPKKRLSKEQFNSYRTGLDNIAEKIRQKVQKDPNYLVDSDRRRQLRALFREIAAAGIETAPRKVARDPEEVLLQIHTVRPSVEARINPKEPHKDRLGKHQPEKLDSVGPTDVPRATSAEKPTGPKSVVDRCRVSKTIGSYEKLAGRIGIGKDTLYAITKETRWLSDHTYELVAAFCGCKPEDLYPRDIPRPGRKQG